MPWVGGVLCELVPVYANSTACALYLLACAAWVVLMKMPLEDKAKQSDASRLTMIREGLPHLWRSKIVLGAISLDLFAVLLGGVTALLPAYAKDILFTGPEGFGHLRSSFAAGAGCLTSCLALRPIKPDAMRGRVSAVSGLFISASNELGEFESGVAARFLGIVGAAVFGGAGSIVVTGLWAKIFPALRKADHLIPTVG